MKIKAQASRPDTLREVVELGEALSGSVDRTITDSLRTLVDTFRRESFTIAVMGRRSGASRP